MKTNIKKIPEKYHFTKSVFLVLTFCVVLNSCSSKKETEPPYSQRMVESLALKTYVDNTREKELKTSQWGYVPGLVANSVLKAWVQYPEKTEYYETVKQYADYCLQGNDTVKVETGNIDDLAAGKIFFVLYHAEKEKGNIKDATRYKNCVTFLRNKLKYQHSRIDASKPGAGGFFHKPRYPDQMWLDGLYMGPALYAEWQHYFGDDEGEEENMKSWSDIALQFKIIHQYTYDASKLLNYHAWSANPEDPNSFWARKSEPYLGCSPEFWGRGMGWYFAALVDVLEFMPGSHPDRQAIMDITQQVASGLIKYQDAESGCWYQLLQYDHTQKADNKGDEVDGKVYNQCNHSNYLESSASSMFTYAYLKGIRLKILDEATYRPVAEKAYQGLLKTFIRTEENGLLQIIQSCASAGLGPARDPSRTGTVNYYLCGKDTGIARNEGKAIGPFVMASLEYERQ